MSCRQVHEIDLAGFLADPRAQLFAAFREHYPACAECASEVRAWTELHLQLAGPESHPSPELLLRFEDQPSLLAPERRAGLEQHMESCASCRDELVALRSFSPPVAVATPARAAPVRETESWGFRLRSLLWQPALAYALVLLLLVPLVLERWDTVSDSSRISDAPRMAQNRAAPGSVPAAARTPAVEVADELVPEERELDLVRELEPRRKQRAAEPAAGALASRARPATEGLATYEEAAQPESLARGRARASAPDLKDEPLELAKRDDAPALDADGAVERVYGALSERTAPMGSPADEAVPAQRKLARSALAGEAVEAAEDAPTELSWRVEGDAIVVELPVTRAASAGELEVRVFHADGRRELVERLALDSETESTPLRIPRDWLGAPATHRVELRMMADPVGAKRVFEYAIVIR